MKNNTDSHFNSCNTEFGAMLLLDNVVLTIKAVIFSPKCLALTVVQLKAVEVLSGECSPKAAQPLDAITQR